MEKSKLGTFEIYQVKSGYDYRDYRFEGIESLKHFGLNIEYDNYDFIYQGELGDMDLEDIFRKFNNNRPKDFKGHSMSVSDIVVLNINGKTTAHFVDSFGYKEVPEFIRQRKIDQSILKAIKINKENLLKKEESNNKKSSSLDER